MFVNNDWTLNVGQYAKKKCFDADFLYMFVYWHLYIST